MTEPPLHHGKISETKEVKVLYKSGIVKRVSLDTDEMIIFRLDKDLIWEVDAEESIYTEVTFAEMEEISKAWAEMSEQMKDIPPEERELMRETWQEI